MKRLIEYYHVPDDDDILEYHSGIRADFYNLLLTAEVTASADCDVELVTDLLERFVIEGVDTRIAEGEFNRILFLNEL